MSAMSSYPSGNTLTPAPGSNGPCASSEPLQPPAGSKRAASNGLSTTAPTKKMKKNEKKVNYPVVSLETFVAEVQDIFSETGKSGFDADKVRSVYERYVHVPTGRSWSASDIRSCQLMLCEIGFDVEPPVELNQMLPEGALKRTGRPVEEANLFIWKRCGQELGIQMDVLYGDLEATDFDKFKWSRRAPKTNGLQNKLARHNGCYTDLNEPVNPNNIPGHGPDPTDITQDYVRHKHPKNSAIKFTNFRFKGELAKFRSRFANVFGPFGYKVKGQFAELNKYYKAICGIGHHGDVERGHGADPGSVNCLKVGRPIPLGFAWYWKTKPVSKADPLPSSGSASFPLVTRKKKKWTKTCFAAAVTLGHGDFYMMSQKAIGKDWKSHDYALRHFAGHRKYTGLPESYYESVEPSPFASAYSLTFSDVVENDSETPELQFSTEYA